MLVLVNFRCEVHLLSVFHISWLTIVPKFFKGCRYNDLSVIHMNQLFINEQPILRMIMHFVSVPKTRCMTEA